MHDKPFAITLDPGSSLANKTGTWRTERPAYVDLMPPCNHACPAGENIQQWLYHAEDGSYEAAWRQIMLDNPLPAIMGRVCYRPCETACNRVQVDAAVGINSVERFLGDEAIRQGWTVPLTAAETGKRVLIVGAGPAGLSAAYHLRLLGHQVTLRDSAVWVGGMMRFGIPAYRLSRDVLDAEISRILAMGVSWEGGRQVTDIEAEMADGGFDAAFLAVGAQKGKRAYIPAGDSARILDAVTLLHSMEGAERPSLGRRVAVYGGGNTAMDAARTARRLGATDAVVVYRRTRDRMPAHEVEVEEATEEGVRMMWLSTIARADEGKLVIEKMALDETGFPQPTGEFTELDADTVVLALGQEAELSLLDGVPGVTIEDGVVQVGADLMTGRPGIFAGGDMVPAERTVTVAIGHGKRAAHSIHVWLTGDTPGNGAARGHGARPAAQTAPRLATFDRLNIWYYSDAPATVRPQLDAARRITTFDEVTGGLDESTAQFEARRCMSCGNCFECDNCYGVCPDNAVVKLGPGRRYEIDLDYCKGCGICAAECPCGAIDMVPERI
ncbi:MAG TPA: NAD(P)-binding protein [Streptosporangiaceae bacterium]|nr:NAD(P)-binding protein [Streptosporangiaceae bacterium]